MESPRLAVVSDLRELPSFGPQLMPRCLSRAYATFWTLTRISLGQQEARPLPLPCSGDERRSNEVNESDLGCTNMFGQGLRLRRLR
ncbi:hypothetical protein VNO77_20054 [Canavalia gladiata]|uniref:Uncharacterized protein n=1 Tax=Canavalia gladiata TaxID=3824 RepID=A0AAN9LNM3_CANGL